MKKVSKEDLPKFQEEIKKKAAEDPPLKQVLRILTEKVENFDKYTGILDELKQVKAVVEQRQAQQPLNPGAPALPAAGQAGIPAGVETLLRYIKPFLEGYLAPKDPMQELVMESMRKSILLTDKITEAVISRIGVLPGLPGTPPGGTPVT